MYLVKSFLVFHAYIVIPIVAAAVVVAASSTTMGSKNPQKLLTSHDSASVNAAKSR